jgi:hypothetical protein
MYCAVIYIDRKMVDANNWLYCSADNTAVIYINSQGTTYITMLCLQFLFIANMIKVVLYEGVIKVRAFGNFDVESTYCLQICYCNGWEPDEEVPELNVKRGNLHHAVGDESESRTPDITAEMGDMTTDKFGNNMSASNTPQKFNRR